MKLLGTSFVCGLFVGIGGALGMHYGEKLYAKIETIRGKLA